VRVIKISSHQDLLVMAGEDDEEESIGGKRKRGLQDDGWHILNEALMSLRDHHTHSAQMEVEQLILVKAKREV